MIAGWTETTIKDAAEFTSKPRGLDVKSVSQVPFIPMNLVPQNGTFIVKYNWKPGKEIKNGNYFEKGNCLLAKITPCFENGKQGIVQQLATEFGYASTELIPFDGRDKVSNKYFLHFFFLETTTRKQMAQKMEGATGRQRLPLSVVKSWPINLPPLSEQKKIAAVLLKIQQAISTQEKIIITLQELKKSTMQHLFTKGLRGEKTKMTEIGEIPESWDVVPMADLRKFLQYGTSLRCTLVKKGSVVLRIPNVARGIIDTEKLKYTNVTKTEQERYILQKGDVLFVRTNGQKLYVGRTAVYKEKPINALFASYLIRARLNTDIILPDFFQMVTETQEGKRQLSGRSMPASDGKFNINTKTINSVLVPVPSINEQKDIAEQIFVIANSLIIHKRLQTHYKSLFETTLNKLMAGEIRVYDLDIDVSEVDI